MSELSENKQVFYGQIREQESDVLSSLSNTVLGGARWTTLLAVIVILVSAVTVLYAIPHYILRPLRAATEAVRELAMGASAYAPFDTRLTELSEMDGALGTFRENAHALHESQDSLRHSNSELSDSNQKLRTFVRVSSHDLKSPLRGISQLTELVEDDLDEKDYESAKYNLGRIRSRAQSLFALLDSLLEYVRVETHGRTVKSVRLRAVVSEQIELLEKSAQASIHINCPDVQVRLRPAPLLVMLRNLVDNALKHHDRERLHVSLTLELFDDHTLHVMVEDDGPGIPVEYQQQVFEPFETLKPKHQTQSSGMGLAIISRVVEAEGGTLTLTSPISSDGRVCRFIVAWPLASVPETSQA